MRQRDVLRSGRECFIFFCCGLAVVGLAQSPTCWTAARAVSSGRCLGLQALASEREAIDPHQSRRCGSEERTRRDTFFAGLTLLSCGCALCISPHPADAMATLVAPTKDATRTYDPPRDRNMDSRFAKGMATGMVEYERAVFKKKRDLFEQLFAAMPSQSSTIVEVGMGSFPNALYMGRKKAPNGMDIIGVDPNDSMNQYALENARQAGVLETPRKAFTTNVGMRSEKYMGRKKAPTGMDINGVDPNDSMDTYARENAQKAGILETPRGNSLRIVHGVAEALPLDSNTADAVVCTLTLCSVLDPKLAVAEIKRVLKPGGKYLFLEHVLSEDPKFAEEQIQQTPSQVKRADGCHLDRRTLSTIRDAGFQSVDGSYFELQGFNYLNPTAAGIATA